MNGQQIPKFASDLSLFALIFFLSNIAGCRTLILIPVFVYECFETASWVYIHSNITYQVIVACDLYWVYEYHPDYLVLIGFVVIILVFIIAAENNLPKHPKKVHVFTILFACQMLPAFSLVFGRSLYYSLYPFSLNSVSINQFTEGNILISFKAQPKIIAKPPEKDLKNLIIIQLESFEMQSMGAYNKRYPKVMKFMSELSKRGTLLTNLIPQPYTSWTTGSIFASNCGFPHVVSDIVWEKMSESASPDKWPQVPCITDFLAKAGYSQYLVSAGGTGSMGMMNFYQQHHVKVIDDQVHGFGNDWDTLEYVKTNIFSEIKQKKPFFLMITNTDTHPFFTVDYRCEPMLDVPKVMQAFNCVDQIFEKFFDAYETAGIMNNTELVVLGDHLMIGRYQGVYDPPRKLAMFFPYHKKQIINKPTTIYDFAPTILNLLNINYSPSFPFGADIFSDNIGTFPKESDFALLYNLMKDKINSHVADKITCGGKDGFCKDESEYIKDRSDFKLDSKDPYSTWEKNENQGNTHNENFDEDGNFRHRNPVWDNDGNEVVPDNQGEVIKTDDFLVKKDNDEPD